MHLQLMEAGTTPLAISTSPAITMAYDFEPRSPTYDPNNKHFSLKSRIGTQNLIKNSPNFLSSL